MLTRGSNYAQPGSHEERFFMFFDFSLTVIFLAELVFHMFCKSNDRFYPFYSSVNNIFGTLEVLTRITNPHL